MLATCMACRGVHDIQFDCQNALVVENAALWNLLNRMATQLRHMGYYTMPAERTGAGSFNIWLSDYEALGGKIL